MLLARDLNLIHSRARINHEERIVLMCEVFAVPLNKEYVETITRLRRELIHEALWDGTMPGHARSFESLYSPFWLNKLTRRLVFGLLGFEGGYISSVWWKLGQFSFDLTPGKMSS